MMCWPGALMLETFNARCNISKLSNQRYSAKGIMDRDKRFTILECLRFTENALFVKIRFPLTQK